MTLRIWLTLLAVPFLADFAQAQTAPKVSDQVAIEILEGVPDKKSWELGAAKVTDRYTEPAFGLAVLPRKYGGSGIIVDRSNPTVVRATGPVALAAGEYRILLRSRHAARVWIDGKLVVETKFVRPNGSAHEHVPVVESAQGLPLLPVGHQEKSATLKLEGGVHKVKLATFVGGQKMRLEMGEPFVALAKPGAPYRLLSPAGLLPLDDDSWAAYVSKSQARHFRRDNERRRAARASEADYWQKRHELARAVAAKKPALALPPSIDGLPEHNAIDRFINRKLAAQKVKPAPLCDDWSFLRRVTLDTVGVVPTAEEIAAFKKDTSSQRRVHVIERLLDDERWADHWVGYWQDVLAENPGILKPMLNNTGPFRWWIHEAFLDNLPADRLVTELVQMEGSKMYGGPAGFGMATQNDVPMAAKAQILGKAFLAVELGCARCHDAPHHDFVQKDTFELAALLARKPVTVPKSSSVNKAERVRRPLIDVTLEPGTKVHPAWPFPELAPSKLHAGILRDPKNPRERLAALITTPQNDRFARVMVNRLWQRYMGWGLIEPVDDWEATDPSHPKLLDYLARELITHDYDLKHVARLIFASHAYQRRVQASPAKPPLADDRLFASPARRRLAAEQIVDSLFVVAGKQLNSEQLTLDPEGRKAVYAFLNLGAPRRAWEFTSLSNERDRPALALPVAQSVVDMLDRYGWRQSRQNPVTKREETATALQPLILANGTVGNRICRLSDDNRLTELCLQDLKLPELIDAVFLQVLTRPPSAAERAVFTELLQEGFAKRRVPGFEKAPKTKALRPIAVSWSNHLSPEATRLKLELERRIRQGDPPTQRLHKEWRERMEDMIWSLVNSPEFVFVP